MAAEDRAGAGRALAGPRSRPMPAALRAQWLEWAAHNLALGHEPGALSEEMTRGGLRAADARDIIEEVRASPIHAAGRRIAADLRQWTSLGDALLRMESQAFDYRRIPRVAGLSSEEFLRDYYALNRPVILTDVAARWPALSKWTLDFLRTGFGAEQIRYQWGRSAADHRDSLVDHGRSGTLADYLDLVEAGTPTNHHYLTGRDQLFDRPAFKPLLRDIAFDPRYFDASQSAGRVFFWLGPAGTTTPLHRDPLNAYLAQIRGRKAVRLVPARQMHLVYNETGYHSEVDLDADSLDDYPRFKEAFMAEEIINPGELLFIPLGWWHYVKALDVSITITGTNFRFDNDPVPELAAA